MSRELCCGKETSSKIFRLAVLQFILYTTFITLYICGAVLIDDTPENHKYEDEDDDFPVIADRVFITAAILNAIPLILAFLLLYGALTQKYYYLRIYIFLKIFETIINALVQLGFAIYYALRVEIIYAILLCAWPVVVGIWMLQCVVIVNVYYNSKTKPKTKNQFVEKA